MPGGRRKRTFQSFLPVWVCFVFYCLRANVCHSISNGLSHFSIFSEVFYIKTLSQTVQCLYFEAELPLQVPTGLCPLSLCLCWANVTSPHADWTVEWWSVEVMVFFQFRTGIKILHLVQHLATFFIIAQPRCPVLLPREGVGFVIASGLLEPSELTSSPYRVAAAPVLSFWRVSSPEV